MSISDFDFIGMRRRSLQFKQEKILKIYVLKTKALIRDLVLNQHKQFFAAWCARELLRGADIIVYILRFLTISMRRIHIVPSV